MIAAENREHRYAVFALIIAGLGWGTTGLFVRALSTHGLSVYELLMIRLFVTGLAMAPVLAFSLSRRPRNLNFKILIPLGISMSVYYLGAITAFYHLPLAIAALIIGSSPLLAWMLPMILARRWPARDEHLQGLGVGLATIGFIALITARSSVESKTATSVMSDFLSAGEAYGYGAALGYLGAALAALVTVFNSRFLRQMGPRAPHPYEITMATVLSGLALAPLAAAATISPSLLATMTVAYENLALAVGFGILATAVPGVAIAYASVRLPPQMTATVSIQLQVWATILAWWLFDKSLSFIQIVGVGLVLVGSGVCLRQRIAAPAPVLHCVTAPK